MSTLDINHCLTERISNTSSPSSASEIAFHVSDRVKGFGLGEIAEKVYEEVLAQRQLAIRP